MGSLMSSPESLTSDFVLCQSEYLLPHSREVKEPPLATTIPLSPLTKLRNIPVGDAKTCESVILLTYLHVEGTLIRGLYPFLRNGAMEVSDHIFYVAAASCSTLHASRPGPRLSSATSLPDTLPSPIWCNFEADASGFNLRLREACEDGLRRG